MAIAELDFPAFRRRARAGRRTALAKACGAAPGLRVHDAMAGWGTDGLVLAALGCVVHMSERESVVHELLDARVAAMAGRLEHIASVTTACEDGRDAWAEATFDVIYFDPMFGPHPKSAAPAKRMRVLAALARETPDAELIALIEAARKPAKNRVVVKRRANAPTLGEPHWSVRGRSVRFDVYRSPDERLACARESLSDAGADGAALAVASF